MSIYIKFRPDRTMVIHATGAVRKELQRGLKLDRTNGNSLEAACMEHEILTWLGDRGYPPIPPEAVGALTEAPMCCDDINNPTEVWAFMAYEVTTIPAQLADFGFAVLEHSLVEKKVRATPDQRLQSILEGLWRCGSPLGRKPR